MSEKLKVIHEGVLNVGETEIPCYILEDGTRLLSGRGMQTALSLTDESIQSGERPGNYLVAFINSKKFNPFIINEKSPEKFIPITCYKGEQKINGYEATVLVDVCDGVLDARKHVNLSTKQAIIAEHCEMLMRSFAKVGIIALVDEATGYQYERERDELQKILKAYIAEELIAWQKRFPDVFYREIFRLNGWDYTVRDIKKRPSVIGKWTNLFIYEQLPKGVLKELKDKTPKNDKGNYTAKFHQSLTQDIGNPHLQAQINSVIPLMQISDNWQQFVNNFNKMIARRTGQLEIKYDDVEYKGEPKKVEETPFNKALGAIMNVPKPDK